MKKKSQAYAAVMVLCSVLIAATGCGRDSSGPGLATEQDDLIKYMQDHAELFDAKESGIDDSY